VSVLIVSVKAAGLGFTINSANVVVHLDVWWNVSLEHQSTDRSHRIGQKNKLINIKLLMNNSIETKTYSLQNYKRGLFFNFFSK
jgi:SNF2 family DNA or RNA helicase